MGDLRVTYKAFVLEQANFGESRGKEWKAWEDDRFPSRDIPPHEAAKSAALQGEGAFSKYHLELHRAKHRHGKDITNQLVLRDVAVAVGLDVDRWEEDVKSGSTRPLIGREHEEAVDEWGVFGVPTLLFDGANPVFAKLKEGDWEGTDDDGLMDSIISASVQRPYILELKTPVSAKLAEASRQKYRQRTADRK